MPIGVTLVGGIVFYVLIAALATATAAYLFARVAHFGPAVTLPTAFALSGLGILGMALASSIPVAVLGAVVAGLGNGLLLPALLTWALNNLTFEQRGRGTGIWTSALFIGQFVCPLLILALADITTGLPTALLVVAVAALLLGTVVRFTLRTHTANAVDGTTQNT